MILYDPFRVVQTKYLFLTGKGGVGKTSVACATAVALADAGKKVLLISTDPASNLQDVFSMELTNKATAIDAVPNLAVANLDPVQAAAEYRESVIGPYRGLLPEAALRNMEEQLSGSCTVEIAAFNEFTNFLTDETVAPRLRPHPLRYDADRPHPAHAAAAVGVEPVHPEEQTRRVLPGAAVGAGIAERTV